MAKKKGGGKSPKKGKGGKSPKKGRDKSPPKGPVFIDHTRFVPKVVVPRLTVLPKHVKDAASADDLGTLRHWMDEENGNGHVDARYEPVSGFLSQPVVGKGWTMLMAAAANKAELAVIYLLDQGADVNLQDDNGDAAIHFAARSRMCGFGMHDASDRIVLALLKAGTDVTLSNRRGQRPEAIINPMFMGGHHWADRVAQATPPSIPPRLLFGGGSRPVSASAEFLMPSLGPRRASHDSIDFAAKGVMHTERRYLNRGATFAAPVHRAAPVR